MILTAFRLSSLAMLALALSGPCLPAWAQGSSPYYLGGSLGLTRVSNLYREANTSNDDTVTSLGLLAGIDQTLGRQRLSVDASMQDNRYSSNSALDNRSYSLRAGLDWQTVANLSGTLGASTSRSLADFNIGRGADLIRSRNQERNDQANFLARLGGLGRYSVEAGLNYRQRDFSAVEYDRFVYHQTESTLGAYATPGAHLRLGLVGRRTQGTSPRYPRFFNGVLNGTEANDYRRNDIDLTTRWEISPASTLSLRLSRSSIDNSLDSVRDFSGTTGAVGATWQASPRLWLSVQASRDTGQETSVRGADLDRVYRAIELNANYTLTAKIALTASARRSRSSSVTALSPQDAFDNDSNYGLGARWAYSRSLSLSCRANHSSRDSSTPLYSYSANSTGCVAQTIFY
jgi:hypothetical protein